MEPWLYYRLSDYAEGCPRLLKQEDRERIPSGRHSPPLFIAIATRYGERVPHRATR